MSTTKFGYVILCSLLLTFNAHAALTVLNNSDVNVTASIVQFSENIRTTPVTVPSGGGQQNLTPPCTGTYDLHIFGPSGDYACQTGPLPCQQQSTVEFTANKTCKRQ